MFEELGQRIKCIKFSLSVSLNANPAFIFVDTGDYI